MSKTITLRGVRLVALLLGVLLLVGGQPTRSAGTRPIAFLSSPPTSSEPSELFLISPDGTGLLRLGVQATSVDWSADGTQLVFSAPGPNQHGEMGELFVIGAEGGTPQPLGVSGWNPRWSPTGEWIAFAGHGQGESFELFVIRPDGTGLRSVGVATSTFDWSPDGARLGFIGYSLGRSRQSSSDLFLIRPDGTGLTPLGVQAIQFSWSPDSSQLVFTTPEENDLYRINADGTGLTHLGVSGWYPQWSPSSDLIAFLSAAGRQGHTLYVIHSDGSGRRNLGVETSSFAWSPGSDQIVFAGDELHLINVDGTGLTPLGVAGWFVTWFAPRGLVVTSISPTWAPNTGPLTNAVIRGANFGADATVHLERSGQPHVEGTDVDVVSDKELKAQFDLTGVEVGLWDVVVTSGGLSGRLKGGLRVTETPPAIDRVEPAVGYNLGPSRVTIHGHHFRPAAKAFLLLRETEIEGTDTTVADDGQSLTTTFPLYGAEGGVYDVRVVNSDGSQGERPHGFTVEAIGRPEAWRGLAMVGVPLVPGNPNPAPIVEFLNPFWARYNPTAGGYVYYSEDPNHFTWFEPPEDTPGKGYWAKFPPDEKTLPQGMPIAQDQPYPIPLQKGWNQISSPFLGPVAWDPETIQVREAGGEAKPLAAALDLMEDYAWGWEQNPEDPNTGQYVLIADAALTRSSRSDLEPWLGYWVYAHKACELIVSRAQGRSAARTAPPREAGLWTVDLVARQGEAVDSGNLLGVAPASRNRGLQVASPPPAPGQSASALDLHFVGSQGRLLAADLRSPTESQPVWDVIVNHDPDAGAVTLTWPGLRELPRDVALTLVDRQTGERRYLRTVSHYTYQPTRGETARRFQIVAGPSSGSLQITNLQVRSTRGDGRTLQVSFALSGAATTRLDVQTLSGRVIAQPEVSQTRTAGLQSLTWTATDADGRPLPAGVYLLRVVAQDDEGRQISAVRTVEIR